MPISGLELHDLEVTLPGKRPLLKIDRLTFHTGSVHVMLGRSGAGKSMVANAIAGLPIPGASVTMHVLASDGSHRADDAGTSMPRWRRKIFLIPQEPSMAFDPTMPIGSQIGEVLRWRCAGKTVETDLVSTAATVDLDKGDLEKLPHACSGGMLQRALVAMAIVADADLTIVDEPTKALDEKRRAETANLLYRLKQARRSLFVITHDLTLTRTIGDQMTVLEAGRVVEAGPAKALLASPASAALKALVAAEPDRWRDARFAPTISRASVPIMALEGIGHSVGQRRQRLFCKVNLSVSAGEIVGLFGPSGAGKTTLADIALGLTLPDEGRVHWRGRPLNSLAARDRRAWRPDFMKLFQDPVATFPPWLTVARVLGSLTPCRNPDYVGKRGLSRLLERLRLAPDLLQRRPKALSGGELQRLAIARTVLASPAFLVCDEPSSRQDMVVQKETVDLLVEFAREMATGMLFITHDVRILARIADRSVELRYDASAQYHSIHSGGF